MEVEVEMEVGYSEEVGWSVEARWEELGVVEGSRGRRHHCLHHTRYILRHDAPMSLRNGLDTNHTMRSMIVHCRKIMFGAIRGIINRRTATLSGTRCDSPGRSVMRLLLRMSCGHSDAMRQDLGVS